MGGEGGRLSGRRERGERERDERESERRESDHGHHMHAPYCILHGQTILETVTHQYQHLSVSTQYLVTVPPACSRGVHMTDTCTPYNHSLHVIHTNMCTYLGASPS